MKKKLFTVAATSLFLITAFSTVHASGSETGQQKSVEKQQVLEEQRVELREIWDDHQVEVERDKTENATSLNYTGAIGHHGDILIALDSITDHVGLVKDSYVVIESHPDNPGGDVAYRDNNWGTRYNEIKGMEVKNASWTNQSEAIDYAEDQLGEPYNIWSGRWSTDEWYCSKLVWRAYYSQGIDLEGRTYEPRGTHITPGDILDNPQTLVFYSS